MWPTLINFGFFQLKSLTLLAILALFFAAFVFWHKGKEEHYDNMELFDAFLISGAFGVAIGRLSFVLFNLALFKDNWWLIFNLNQVPGNIPLLTLVAAGFCLYFLAKKRKWDPFEILDFWVTAISLGMIFLYFGFFLAGSYPGRFTSMPWGVVMPGNFEKSHPVQLYFFVFYLLLFNYLLRVEYRYRTFEWYRRGRKTAQSGFLLSTFLIAVGSFYLLMTAVSVPRMLVLGTVIDHWVYLVLLIFGVFLLLSRSGLTIKAKHKKPPQINL